MKPGSLELTLHHVSCVQRLLRSRIGQLGCPPVIFGYEKERRHVINLLLHLEFALSTL